jgi:hypothetical protein
MLMQALSNGFAHIQGIAGARESTPRHAMQYNPIQPSLSTQSKKLSQSKKNRRKRKRENQNSPPNPFPLPLPTNQLRHFPRDILRTIPMALQSLVRVKTRITRHKQHIVTMDRVLFQL